MMFLKSLKGVLLTSLKKQTDTNKWVEFNKYNGHKRLG